MISVVDVDGGRFIDADGQEVDESRGASLLP